jgi:hypothetical protein
MNANEPVAVFTTNDPSQAQILKNYLEAEGIACELDGENQAGLTALLDIRLLVRAWDEDRARRVLASHGHFHEWQSAPSPDGLRAPKETNHGHSTRGL